MRNAGLEINGPEGYLVAYDIARDILSCGLSVVADSVNPISSTRDAWRNVACDASAGWVEIEITCSDRAEHRRRVESRVSDIRGLALPNWIQVVNREFDPWPAAVKVDTAGRAPGSSVEMLRTILEQEK
jgi:predicted kinase